jgi:hypothetical protein
VTPGPSPGPGVPVGRRFLFVQPSPEVRDPTSNPLSTGIAEVGRRMPVGAEENVRFERLLHSGMNCFTRG